MATPRTGRPRGRPKLASKPQSLKLTLPPEVVEKIRAIAVDWGGIGPHLPLATVARSLIELGLRVEDGVRKAGEK